MKSGARFFRPLRFWRLAGFLLAAVWPAAAQTIPVASADYLIHVWNSGDGLPQISVNCLAQTPERYLWIGTRSGELVRFDGARFVTYNPQTTPELKDVEFETLSVDSRGTLWITAGMSPRLHSGTANFIWCGSVRPCRGGIRCTSWRRIPTASIGHRFIRRFFACRGTAR